MQIATSNTKPHTIQLIDPSRLSHSGSTKLTGNSMGGRRIDLSGGLSESKLRSIFCLFV
jgi:hypothetical protein